MVLHINPVPNEDRYKSDSFWPDGKELMRLQPTGHRSSLTAALDIIH
jgi:hypothetical protein